MPGFRLMRTSAQFPLPHGSPAPPMPSGVACGFVSSHYSARALHHPVCDESLPFYRCHNCDGLSATEVDWLHCVPVHSWVTRR